MEKNKIFTIEDDEETAEFLKVGLELEGFFPIKIPTGKEGVQKAIREKPDLILLDLGLPDMDGVEVCKTLKEDERTKDIPIIMLTARSLTSDKVTGLEAGADDYIVKPFTPQELIARIKALLRRTEYYTTKPQVPEESITKSGITVDPTTHRVLLVKSTEIDLTPKEFDLLYILMKNSGKVVERGYLLKMLWGYKEGTDSRTLDVHILRIRKKLTEEHSSHIMTVEGIGFKFVP